MIVIIFSPSCKFSFPVISMFAFSSVASAFISSLSRFSFKSTVYSYTSVLNCGCNSIPVIVNSVNPNACAAGSSVSSDVISFSTLVSFVVFSRVLSSLAFLVTFNVYVF